MGCPPVLGDNPRALASGLSYVQMDKHSITINTNSYSIYIREDLAHHKVYSTKKVKEIVFGGL